MANTVEHEVQDGAASNAPAAPHRKFVRVLERHPNGFVKFEFAVGWPDLACELALPQALFDEFCAHHHVEFMTAEQAGQDRNIAEANDDEH
jgi:phenol/toluene 2-monooxygenase (NADH) P0/A0